LMKSRYSRSVATAMPVNLPIDYRMV
jgi:hypothetical protein